MEKKKGCTAVPENPIDNDDYAVLLLAVVNFIEIGNRKTSKKNMISTNDKIAKSCLKKLKNHLFGFIREETKVLRGALLLIKDDLCDNDMYLKDSDEEDLKRTNSKYLMSISRLLSMLPSELPAT